VRASFCAEPPPTTCKFGEFPANVNERLTETVSPLPAAPAETSITVASMFAIAIVVGPEVIVLPDKAIVWLPVVPWTVSLSETLGPPPSTEI
jgi:hypothetical protein